MKVVTFVCTYQDLVNVQSMIKDSIIEHDCDNYSNGLHEHDMVVCSILNVSVELTLVCKCKYSPVLPHFACMHRQIAYGKC